MAGSQAGAWELSVPAEVQKALLPKPRPRLPGCRHSSASLLVTGSLVRSHHKNNRLLEAESSVLPSISPPASLSQKGKAERAPLSALSHAGCVTIQSTIWALVLLGF